MSVPVWWARRAKVAAVLAAQRRRITDLQGRLRGLGSAHAEELAAQRRASEDRLAVLQRALEDAQRHRDELHAEAGRLSLLLTDRDAERAALIAQLGRQSNELHQLRTGGSGAGN